METDDIVTRLRDMANSVIEKTDPRFQWLVDAADEIERLRTENYALREWAEYEHAGDCRCCGTDKECLEKAFNYVKETC